MDSVFRGVENVRNSVMDVFKSNVENEDVRQESVPLKGAKFNMANGVDIPTPSLNARPPQQEGRRLSATPSNTRRHGETNLQVAAGQAVHFQGDWDSRHTIMKALIVGCNYPTSAPIQQQRGAVADAYNWASLLLEHYAFQKDNIALLVDMDHNNNAVSVDYESYPSRANILENLDWLTEDARPGDVRVFIFAGLGVQVPDDDGDEEDGLDEAICPADYEEEDGPRGLSMRVITDDELARKFMNLPKGVNLTLIMDCAHASSMLDVATRLDSSNPDCLNEFTLNVEGTGYSTQKDSHLGFDAKTWSNNPASSKCRPRRALDVPTRSCWRKVSEFFTRLCKPRKTLDNEVIGFCFAACREDQTAVEFLAGEPTGLLSHCLLQALDRLRYHCTYHKLFIEASNILDSMKSKALPSIDQKMQLSFTAKANPMERMFLTGILPGEVKMIEDRLQKQKMQYEASFPGRANKFCGGMCGGPK